MVNLDDLRIPNFIICVLNDDVDEADDVIMDEYRNEYDVGYVNVYVFEYGNEYESANVNDCDYVYVCGSVYDNE